MAVALTAPHAPTSTDVTSQDIAPSTPAWTTPNSPAAERTVLNHLRALAIPPAAAPRYLAQLSPPPPLPPTLLSGFLRVLKLVIPVPGFPSLSSTKENPFVIDSNVLENVSLGHTAGPFPPPFLISKFTRLGLFLTNIPQSSGQFSTYPTPNTDLLASTPTSSPETFLSSTLKLIMRSPYSKISVRTVLCPNWTLKPPSGTSWSTPPIGNC